MPSKPGATPLEESRRPGSAGDPSSSLTGLRGRMDGGAACGMNETVRDYCQSAGIAFTRCRPYRKNDQAWVGVPGRPVAPASARARRAAE